MYPDYSDHLTSWTTAMPCTPVGLNLKGGVIRVAGDLSSFMKFNYIKFERGNATIYAWIDNVEYKNETLFDVHYSTDAFRTYRNDFTLGTQYIVRTPTPTSKLDNLLGSSNSQYDMVTTPYIWGNYHNRVLAVQVTPEPAYVVNNTPVQPTPYHFYFASYNPDNWQASSAIVELMAKLRATQASNIITIYSLPYMNISKLPTTQLPLFQGEVQKDTVQGFKFLSGTLNVKDLLTRDRLIAPPMQLSMLSRRPFTTHVMIPDAGIMNIPIEVWAKGNVKVRQDVDIFSGASNYMITAGDNDDITGISVRGSSTSTIPILSSPFDTYLSQNQNALTTSLIGDVASVIGGAGSFMVAPNMVSGGVALKGVTGLISNVSSLADKRTQGASNPASFLGTAMANHFSSNFFLISQYLAVSNAEMVNEAYGYPFEYPSTAFVPNSGYIQLQNCNVSSDGSIPRWALEEINGIFNSGLRVRT